MVISGFFTLAGALASELRQNEQSHQTPGWFPTSLYIPAGDLILLSHLRLRNIPSLFDFANFSAVSHSYGYGLLDAKAMVTLAKNWTTVGPQHQCVHPMLTEPRLVNFGHFYCSV